MDTGHVDPHIVFVVADRFESWYFFISNLYSGPISQPTRKI